METIAVLVMDEHNLIASLDKAGKSLQSELELTLDFSGVGRVDSPGLRAIQDLAHRAEEKKVKVVVRGVNVNVYKTLKLARLTQRFSFAN
jgi:anti-anti-sigma regulatory factor